MQVSDLDPATARASAPIDNRAAPLELAPDADLLRLLDAYGQAEYELGSHPSYRRYDRQRASKAAPIAHIAARYVRRDGYKAARGAVPWRPGDELPEEDPGPPIVSLAKRRVPATIRGTGAARAARYGKEELTDGA